MRRGGNLDTDPSDPPPVLRPREIGALRGGPEGPASFSDSRSSLHLSLSGSTVSRVGSPSLFSRILI